MVSISDSSCYCRQAQNDYGKIAAVLVRKKTRPVYEVVVSMMGTRSCC
jgi:hypothetical protein